MGKYIHLTYTYYNFETGFCFVYIFLGLLLYYFFYTHTAHIKFVICVPQILVPLTQLRLHHDYVSFIIIAVVSFSLLPN